MENNELRASYYPFTEKYMLVKISSKIGIQKISDTFNQAKTKKISKY